ncbi:DUF4112 domain-containing protein [soil metagenome]
MSKERAHQSWRTAERVKRLSDRLVGFGPFGIGLDGILAWVPGANLIYSVAAGGLLLIEGVAAKASMATLLRMGVYLAADAGTSEVPIIGWAIDTVFPAHLMAAKALQKDIEARHGPVEMPGWGGRKKAPKGKLRNVTPL